MILAHLDTAPGPGAIARACGLSPNHFRRAFRQSVGVPPHRWLLLQRIELAKAKLREPHLSLGEVALACGFADQSHFTRNFARLVGVTPGRWRREQGIDARIGQFQTCSDNRGAPDRG